ncbi:MAG TPA: hypothetical protein VGC14_04265 [Rhizobium sp.]
MGDTLRQISRRNEQFKKLRAAAVWLAANHSQPVTIPDLAASVRMSVTSFRHFKAVTGVSLIHIQETSSRCRETKLRLSTSEWWDG